MKRLLIIAILTCIRLLLPQTSHIVDRYPAPLLKPVAAIKPLSEIKLQPLPELAPLPFPVAPQGTYASTYDYGNCTAYVASRIKVPDSWGNANTWAAAARAQGITVSSVPIVGSIAQSTAGYFGHVAVVEAVSGGQVEVSEMNVRGLAVVDTAWYPAGYFNNYIYV